MTDQEEKLKRRRDDFFTSCPRFDKHELTDEQIEDIATKAATKALELGKTELYTEVGKGIMSRFFWIVGWVVVTVVSTLFATGHVKFPWSN